MNADKILCGLIFSGLVIGQEVNPDQRLEHATAALRVFLSSENQVGKAECIVVVPHLMKGVRLVGAKRGRGFASCRRSNGGWSSPAAIALEGGNLSTSQADVVLLTDEKTLLGESGGEMLAFLGSKDAFVAVPLDGVSVHPDNGENKKLYGHEVGNREILEGKVPPPKGARGYVALLNRRAKRTK